MNSLTAEILILSLLILTGVFGGATVAETLAAHFVQFPALEPYSEALGFWIVVTVITYFSLIFGEAVPKRLALSSAERIATLVAPIMQFLSTISGPLVSLLSASTEFVVRLLGIKPASEPTVIEEEVKILIEQGRETGVFEDVEQEIVERVFRLSDRSVNSLMTHRSEMVWLDVEDPLEENIKKILTPGQSNFVVCQGELDHVIGVLDAKDLLRDYPDMGSISIPESFPMPPFVSEGMNALEVVAHLRSAKSSVALVVDEHGTIDGMATLADVLEAIVGNILALDEKGEPAATRRDDGSWLLDAMMPVDELPQDADDYDTVGDDSWRNWVVSRRWVTSSSGRTCASRLWIWTGSG